MREHSRLKPANAFATEYRTLKDDLEGAREILGGRRRTRSCASSCSDAPRDGGARRGASPGDGRARPERRQERDRRDQVRRRGRRGRAVRRRPLPDAHQLRGAARASRPRSSPPRRPVGGFKDVTFAVKGDGAYTVFKYEAGVHRVQRVPRRSRRAGSTRPPRRWRCCPRRRTSRSHRPQRPPDRRLPLVRPRRPVREHDRLGRADHAQAHRPGGLDAGREVPAAKPRARPARAARAPV